MNSHAGSSRSVVRAFLLCAALCSAAPAAGAIRTAAKHACIVDHRTGAVLLEKNADAPAPPASLSKLMTLYMVFERLESETLSLDDTFAVSRKAWRKGGSKTFVEVGRRVRVEDLVRGMVVQSGNDASIVVAEGLSGSERAFADAMNLKARELGLAHSSFVNASGWPAAGHVMSARDLAVLARRIIEQFPDHYRYFSETSFRYNGIEQRNRNPLLRGNTGADGLKTGYTREAGYGLVASAVREGRRIVMVLTGLPSARKRSAEARRLLDWAYRTFANYTLFARGAVVDRADVRSGEQSSVPLVAEKDIVVSLPRAARPGLETRVVHDVPVWAPVARGTRLARLVISGPGIEPREWPLVAGADVARMGLFGRFFATLGRVLRGPDR